MDSIRVTAKTVSDAITEASIQLETSSDNIEYTIICLLYTSHFSADPFFCI